MKLPAVPVGAGTVTLFPAIVVTVRSGPAPIWYVKVYGAVPPEPVKVILGDVAFWHTAVVPETDPFSNALTVITAVPVWACEQAVELLSSTLTKA